MGAQKSVDTKLGMIESCRYTSGSGQAGVLSPLLSPIYLDKLEKMILVWKKERVVVFDCIPLGLLNEREQRVILDELQVPSHCLGYRKMKCYVQMVSTQLSFE